MFRQRLLLSICIILSSLKLSWVVGGGDSLELWSNLGISDKRRKIKRVPVKLKWAENFGEMSTNIYQHFRDGIIMSSKYSEIFGRRALKYVYH